MKLPKTLWIGNTEWRIKQVKKLPNDDWGLCDYETETIFIKRSLTVDAKIITFVHELLHCFDHEDYGIEIPHHLIYALELPIAKLIMDNFL